MDRKTLVTVLITLAGCIGLFVYFVSGITETYNIKFYRYSLTRDQLEQRLLQAIDANPNVTFKPSDTTGTDRNNRAYHADIVIKTATSKYYFSIKYYKNSNFWDRGVNSEMSLVQAMDLKNNIGGYSAKAPGVDKLIEVFEKEIIKKIDNTSR